MKQKAVKKLFSIIGITSLLFTQIACGEEADRASSVENAGMDSTSKQTDIVLTVTDNGTDTIFGGEDSDVLHITVAMPSNTSLHTEPNQWYDRLVKEVNEYTGMDITWKWYATSEYEKRIEQDILSGDVADVILIWNKTEWYRECVEAGLLWEVGPYLDAYDNHAETFEISRLNGSYNGKLYGLPRKGEPVHDGLGYRVDWLNKLGLEAPTDWESFEKMLYAFTYNDPDGNGVDDTVGLFLDCREMCWDTMESWFGVPNIWGIDENGDLIHKSGTQEYREAYKVFRELYAQGVINNGSHGIKDFREYTYWGTEPDMITQAGAAIGYLYSFTNAQDRLEEQGAVPVGEIVYALCPCVDTGVGELCCASDGVRGLIAVTTERIKTEEQLERVLQFLSDLNDAPCDILLRNGWEGITYGVEEENPNIIANSWRYPEQYAQTGAAKYQGGLTEILTGFVTEENKRTIDYENSPIVERYNQLAEEYRDNCVINYGYQFYTETEKVKGEELDALLFEAEIQYITGEIDEAGFEAALNTWWEKGGAELTEEINTLYHEAGY